MELQEDMILMDQKIPNKTEAIKRAGQLLVDAGNVDPPYVDAMIERDQLVSTHMGNFIAIPHGTNDAKNHVKKSGISIIQVPEGVNFGDEDKEKTAMMIFGVAGAGNEHVEILQKIALFCSQLENVEKLVEAKTPTEVMELFKDVG